MAGLNFSIFKYLLLERDQRIDDERQQRRLAATIRADKNYREWLLSLERQHEFYLRNRADVFEDD